MRQDPQQVQAGPAQPQRRRVMMAVAAIAGLALTRRLPAPFDAGAEFFETGGDLLGQLLKALGYRVDASAALTNADIELHLTRILRAPLAVLASDQDVKRRIRRNIEADYQAGDIRVVDGWWLSATEANCLELIERARAG